MISLIIPTNGTNKEYTDNLVNNIRDLYPNKDEVEIIIEINSKANLAKNYNNAVARAKGDKIILLHNDMVISPGFVETIDKHIQKGRITTYTRIEPPIYNDTYPGKVIMDCGRDLNSFKQSTFNSVKIGDGLIDGGSQLFFGCMKEDYMGIDNNTFSPPQMWCADDDLHLRYKIAGFEHKVSPAYVYHFVSKTSRASSNSKQIELNSNRNFIRKWGWRSSIHNKTYDIGFRVKHCNSALLEALEPWCTNILIDDEMQVLTTHYIDIEQKNTSFDLTTRILSTPFQTLNNEIIIEIDRHTFTQEEWTYLTQISDIIYESADVGEFELGNLKVTIKEMNEYSKDLIFIENPLIL
jgi:glycosyltransferase involved in cell wall biosynthesis